MESKDAYSNTAGVHTSTNADMNASKSFEADSRPRGDSPPLHSASFPSDSEHKSVETPSKHGEDSAGGQQQFHHRQKGGSSLSDASSFTNAETPARSVPHGQPTTPLMSNQRTKHIGQQQQVSLPPVSQLPQQPQLSMPQLPQQQSAHPQLQQQQIQSQPQQISQSLHAQPMLTQQQSLHTQTQQIQSLPNQTQQSLPPQQMQPGKAPQQSIHTQSPHIQPLPNPPVQQSLQLQQLPQLPSQQAQHQQSLQSQQMQQMSNQKPQQQPSLHAQSQQMQQMPNQQPQQQPSLHAQSQQMPKQQPSLHSQSQQMPKQQPSLHAQSQQMPKQQPQQQPSLHAQSQQMPKQQPQQQPSLHAQSQQMPNQQPSLHSQSQQIHQMPSQQPQQSLHAQSQQMQNQQQSLHAQSQQIQQMPSQQPQQTLHAQSQQIQQISNQQQTLHAQSQQIQQMPSQQPQKHHAQSQQIQQMPNQQQTLHAQSQQIQQMPSQQPQQQQSVHAQSQQIQQIPNQQQTLHVQSQQVQQMPNQQQQQTRHVQSQQVQQIPNQQQQQALHAQPQQMQSQQQIRSLPNHNQAQQIQPQQVQHIPGQTTQQSVHPQSQQTISNQQHQHTQSQPYQQQPTQHQVVPHQTQQQQMIQSQQQAQQHYRQIRQRPLYQQVQQIVHVQPHQQQFSQQLRQPHQHFQQQDVQTQQFQQQDKQRLPHQQQQQHVQLQHQSHLRAGARMKDQNPKLPNRHRRQASANGSDQGQQLSLPLEQNQIPSIVDNAPRIQGTGGQVVKKTKGRFKVLEPAAPVAPAQPKSSNSVKSEPPQKRAPPERSASNSSQVSQLTIPTMPNGQNVQQPQQYTVPATPAPLPKRKGRFVVTAVQPPAVVQSIGGATVYQHIQTTVSQQFAPHPVTSAAGPAVVAQPDMKGVPMPVPMNQYSTVAPEQPQQQPLDAQSVGSQDQQPASQQYGDTSPPVTVHRQAPIVQPQYARAPPSTEVHSTAPPIVPDQNVQQTPIAGSRIVHQVVYAPQIVPQSTSILTEQDFATSTVPPLGPSPPEQVRQEPPPQEERAQDPGAEDNTTDQSASSQSAGPPVPAKQQEQHKGKHANVTQSKNVKQRNQLNSWNVAGGLNAQNGLSRMFYCLEQLRLDTVKTDQIMRKQRGDVKILKDKCNDLEAKNKQLRRKLAQEEALRKEAQEKLKALMKQMGDGKQKGLVQETPVENAGSTKSSKPKATAADVPAPSGQTNKRGTGSLPTATAHRTQNDSVPSKTQESTRKQNQSKGSVVDPKNDASKLDATKPARSLSLAEATPKQTEMGNSSPVRPKPQQKNLVPTPAKVGNATAKSDVKSRKPTVQPTESNPSTPIGQKKVVKLNPTTTDLGTPIGKPVSVAPALSMKKERTPAGLEPTEPLRNLPVNAVTFEGDALSKPASSATTAKREKIQAATEQNESFPSVQKNTSSSEAEIQSRPSSALSKKDRTSGGNDSNESFPTVPMNVVSVETESQSRVKSTPTAKRDIMATGPEPIDSLPTVPTNVAAAEADPQSRAKEQAKRKTASMEFDPLRPVTEIHIDKNNSESLGQHGQNVANTSSADLASFGATPAIFQSTYLGMNPNPSDLQSFNTFMGPTQMPYPIMRMSEDNSSFPQNMPVVQNTLIQLSDTQPMTSSTAFPQLQTPMFFLPQQPIHGLSVQEISQDPMMAQRPNSMSFDASSGMFPPANGMMPNFGGSNFGGSWFPGYQGPFNSVLPIDQGLAMQQVTNQQQQNFEASASSLNWPTPAQNPSNESDPFDPFSEIVTRRQINGDD